LPVTGAFVLVNTLIKKLKWNEIKIQMNLLLFKEHFLPYAISELLYVFCSNYEGVLVKT
jgi:hypothetical protein